MAKKPAYRASDCCRLTRYGLLDERIITSSLYLLDPTAAAAESSKIPIVERLVPAHLIQNPLTLPLYPLSGHPASRYEKGQ